MRKLCIHIENLHKILGNKRKVKDNVLSVLSFIQMSIQINNNTYSYLLILIYINAGMTRIGWRTRAGRLS